MIGNLKLINGLIKKRNMDKLTQVKNVITDFIRGGDNNDVAQLEKAMHRDFQNTQDGFFEQKGIFTFPKDEYIRLVGTRRFGGVPTKH